jgi:serine protease AprX
MRTSEASDRDMPRRRARRIARDLCLGAAVLAAAVHLAVPADAGRKAAAAKLDDALRRAVEAGAGAERVIVRVRAGHRAAVEAELARRGRALHAELPLVGAVATTADSHDLQALAALEGVERISIDAPVRPQMTSGEVLRETLGLKTNGGIVTGGSSWAGDGVGVAIVDSGLEPSKDLEPSRIVAFYDFTQGGRSVRPFDDYGHGTHVAGLIGGTGQLSADRYEGPASKARFIVYKVLDRNGVGYTSHVIAAIEHAIRHRSKLGIDVLNLSLGHPVYEPAATDPLVQAVEAAVAAGIAVVVSAGNYGTHPDTGLPGYGGITSPGNAPSAITVGATDTKDTVTRLDDEVTWYSSRGPTWYDLYAKPDLVAPGHRMVAAAALDGTLYASYPSLRVAYGTDVPRYLRLSGTSMAAAVTSGIVAVMIEAGRDNSSRRASLTPNALKALLQVTAFRLAQTDLLTQGAGAINGVGAIRLASSINATAPLGASWLVRTVQPGDTIGGVPLDWAGQVLWGARLVWGQTVFVNEPAWAPAVRWGDPAVWGARLVWGSGTIVWDQRIVWGQRLVWGQTLLGYDTGSAILYGDAIDWNQVSAERLVWGQIATVDGLDTAMLSAGVP